MSVKPAEVSRYIWIGVASIFVVCAIVAGAIYFRHSKDVQDSRCQELRSQMSNKGPLDELTHDEAVCAGVAN